MAASTGGTGTHTTPPEIYYPPNGPALPPYPPQLVNPSRQNINRTASGPQTASVAPQGTPVPLIYGRQIIGAIVSLVKVVGNKLYLRLVWCIGEVDAIEAVTLNGDPVPLGTTFTHYTGKSDQPVDPTLASVIPGYTDRCIVQANGQTIGVCYSVVVVPANSGTGFPQFTAQIRGLKCRDPRGLPFVPRVDGDFATTQKRHRINYEGTGHLYATSRGTKATALTDSSQGWITGSINLTSGSVKQTIFEAGGGQLSVFVDVNNKINIIGKNSSSVIVLNVVMANPLVVGTPASFALTWKLATGLFVGQVDRVSTASILTATPGSTINLGATGLAIGGHFSATTEQLTASLSGLFFGSTSYFDPNVLINPAKNVNKQSAGDVLMPIGYDSTFGFSVQPTVLSDTGSWTWSGTRDYRNYAAPGLTGGMFVHTDDTTARPINLTPAGAALGSAPLSAYFHADFPFLNGEMVLNTTSGVICKVNTTSVDDLETWTTSGGGDSLAVQSTTAQATVDAVLRQLWISPLPTNFTSQFLNFAVSPDWAAVSGVPTQIDPATGGLSMLSGDEIQSSIVSYVGETVYYQIQISLVAGGSPQIRLGSETTSVITFTAAGYYSGSFVTDGRKLRISDVSGSCQIAYCSIQTKTTAKAWTMTPALMIADLLESQAYGMGGSVNNASLYTLTRYNEQIVPDSGGQKRVQVGIALTSQEQLSSTIETFRAYARCFISVRDNQFFLIPDGPYNQTMQAVTAGDMIAKTIKLSKASLVNQPNVIRVYYTNTTSVPWAENFVDAQISDVSSGKQFPRVSELRMPGFLDKSTAQRYAIERLNNSTLIDLTGSFDAFDTLFPIEPGDVVTITHPYGMTTVPCRVLACDPSDRGKMTVSFTLYNNSVYSDVVVDHLPPPDYHGVSPFEVPPVGPVTIKEEFYNAGTDTMSRLRVTWADIGYPFLLYYQINVYEDGVLLGTVRTGDTTVIQPVAQVGHQYQVTVTPVSVTFVQGLSSTAGYTALGNLLPPDFSNGQIVAYEGGDSLLGYVRQPALDIDLWGYEWRYRRIEDQNLLPQGGPTWLSSDWTVTINSGSTSNTVAYAFRKLSYVSNFAGNNTYQITRNVTGLFTVGKTYVLYVKVLTFGGGFSGISGPFLNVYMPGGTSNKPGYSVDLSINSSQRSIPGLYSVVWTPTSADLAGTPVVTISMGKDAGSGSNMSIEYVGVREQNPADPGDWTTAKFIARDPSGTCQIQSVQTGTYLLYCKALDSVRSPTNPYGQYSAVTQTVSVNVISDTSSYQKWSYPLTFGSQTNFPLYPFDTKTFLDNNGTWELQGTYVPTKTATWNATLTGTVNSVSTPLFSAFVPTSGTPAWISDVYDLGQTITGTGTINFPMKDMAQGATKLSVILGYAAAAAGPFTNVTTFIGQPANFSGRFLRIEIDSSASVSAGIIANGSGTLDIQAIPRTETGNSTTNADDGAGNPVPLTITSANNYTSVISIQAVAIGVSEPITMYVSNITPNPGFPTTFQVFATNLRGFPVAVAFNWELKGV